MYTLEGDPEGVAGRGQSVAWFGTVLNLSRLGLLSPELYKMQAPFDYFATNTIAGRVCRGGRYCDVFLSVLCEVNFENGGISFLYLILATNFRNF